MDRRRTAIALLAVAGCTSKAAPAPAARDAARAVGGAVVTPVPLPDGHGGIGFDDLQYSAALGRVLVPAGRTGALDLIDPQTNEVTQILGFTADASYAGGHGEGTTSAVDAGRWILAIDRTAMQLVVVDPASATIVKRAPLAGSPDYVRWIEATSEAWVTEPDADQIEVFAMSDDGTPAATATIAVEGGPESLVVSANGVADSHQGKGKTVAIDIATRATVATWPNGCSGSRGIALDERRGWLFTGCSEGKATVLDVGRDGRILATIETGAGLDIIAYAPSRQRLYVPSADTGTLTVIDVGDDGSLALAADIQVATGAHGVATDDAGHAWVCDPEHGQVLAVSGVP
jgi:DNA-binding beta-propeller fold protein YncE